MLKASWDSNAALAYASSAGTISPAQTGFSIAFALSTVPIECTTVPSAVCTSSTKLHSLRALGALSFFSFLPFLPFSLLGPSLGASSDAPAAANGSSDDAPAVAAVAASTAFSLPLAVAVFSPLAVLSPLADLSPLALAALSPFTFFFDGEGPLDEAPSDSPDIAPSSSGSSPSRSRCVSTRSRERGVNRLSTGVSSSRKSRGVKIGPPSPPGRAPRCESADAPSSASSAATITERAGEEGEEGEGGSA